MKMIVGKCIMKNVVCDAYSQVLNRRQGTLIKFSNFFRSRRSLLSTPSPLTISPTFPFLRLLEP